RSGAQDDAGITDGPAAQRVDEEDAVEIVGRGARLSDPARIGATSVARSGADEGVVAVATAPREKREDGAGGCEAKKFHEFPRGERTLGRLSQGRLPSWLQF